MRTVLPTAGWLNLLYGIFSFSFSFSLCIDERESCCQHQRGHVSKSLRIGREARKREEEAMEKSICRCYMAFETTIHTYIRSNRFKEHSQKCYCMYFSLSLFFALQRMRDDARVHSRTVFGIIAHSAAAAFFARITSTPCGPRSVSFAKLSSAVHTIGLTSTPFTFGITRLVGDNNGSFVKQSYHTNTYTDRVVSASA